MIIGFCPKNLELAKIGEGGGTEAVILRNNGRSKGKNPFLESIFTKIYLGGREKWGLFDAMISYKDQNFLIGFLFGKQIE